jgi:hypothetical protein
MPFACLIAALVAPASANDTEAGFAAGGLLLVRNDHVEMVSEDLYLSTTEVRVRYEFLNHGERDERLLLAFPMPDLTIGIEQPVSIPSADPANFLGFSTTFDGVSVPAELHQYAFAAGVDRSALLGSFGVPLAPQAEATRAALAALPAAKLAQLRQLGLVESTEYDAGQGWQTEWWPLWTLRTTWTWEAVFPAGRTVVVEHRYTPSVYASAGTSLLARGEHDAPILAPYQQQFCVDDAFLAAVQRATPPEAYSPPFEELRLGYVLTTGANWAGPIGRFHLTVDKGAPTFLVSFCAEGVRKTGPTTFELTAERFWPQRDLDILILRPYGP